MTVPSSAVETRTDAAVLAEAVAAVETLRSVTDRGRVRAAVATAMDGKVKPIGSLGRLEQIAIDIAAVRGTEEPGTPTPAVVICAADHGLNAESVSAYPSEVTGLMLESLAAGGAAVSVLARGVGAKLVVADLGVSVPPECVGREVLDRRVRPGTANSATGDAMTRDEARQALRHGIDIAHDLIDSGHDLVGVGEVGIGNTASASAITARLLDVDAALVVGPGSGLDSEQMRHKTEVVRRVLAAHPDATDPLDVLASMGGLEIAGMAGVMIGCASRGIPVVLDGFITTSAALVAARLAPGSVESMIAGHVSAEPGHAVQLESLGLQPILALDMRLGEGSGAAVAIGVIRQALDILADMATYASLGLGEQ